MENSTMDFQTLLCLQLCSVATSKLEYHMDFTLGRAILRQSWYKSNLYDIILKSVVIIMSQKFFFVATLNQQLEIICMCHWTHWIIEQPRLKGTSKHHLVQPFLGKGALETPSGTLSSHRLKASRDWDSATSLGRLSQ